MNYQARLIVQGKVTNRARFEAPDNLTAYSLVHQDLDPLTGQWIEVRPIPTPRPALDPDKLAPKPDAQRASFTTQQGNDPKESHSAPGFSSKYEQET